MAESTDGRDPSKHTLWWVNSECDARMFFGNFDSEAEAEIAKPAARLKFIKYRDESPEASGFWCIQPPNNA